MHIKVSFLIVIFLFIFSKRGKKGEKGGKGLRHFSMKVCEKVQRKGVTTYNEVADELVAEFSDPRNLTSPSDQVKKYILYPQRTYKMFFSPGMVTLS